MDRLDILEKRIATLEKDNLETAKSIEDLNMDFHKLYMMICEITSGLEKFYNQVFLPKDDYGQNN